MTIAFLFPGQGAQYVGMGKDLAEAYPEAREVFEIGSEVLGLDLAGMCFLGPEERLMETENTQPAILAVSVSVARVLAKHGIRPSCLAGLSLGEYSALVFSGSISLEAAFHIVRERGRYMQEAVPLGKGAMAAIMGLGRDEVERICRDAQGHGVLDMANYNCPGQIVVSGEARAVEAAICLAKEAGAKRAVRLAVSAPFHSRLMEPAAERLAAVLEETEILDPSIPVVSNVGATYLQDARDIRLRLVRQVSSPVMWEDSVRLMSRDGTQVFLEVGPGTALTGFAKRIAPEAQALSVQDCSGLEKALECCRGVC